MPGIPPASDLVGSWEFLAEGVDQIMSKLQSGVSYSKYMSLYTVAYNSCTQSGSKYQGSHNVWAPKTSYDSVGSDLYSRLIKFFVTHLKTLRHNAEDLRDEELLRYYATEWDRYTIGANYVNRLFTYLNRHWVKKEREEGRLQIFEVYTLALDQWRTNFFVPVQQKRSKLSSVILRLIEMQRNGEVIDQGLVKKIIDSFVSIGISKVDPDQTCLDEYRTHFEIPFLAATEAYYSHESATFLANNSVSDYLKKVEERLREEEDRVDMCLHTSTRAVLVHKCEEVMIRRQRHTIQEGFTQMLDFDKDEDLRRTYVLTARLEDGLGPLRKKFEEHVKKAGFQAIQKLLGDGDGNSMDPDTIDPKSYADSLFRTYEKNLETVKRNFNGEIGFITGLEKACGSYINRNPATGTSNSKSSELLAKFADFILRKTSKTVEDDLENSLNQVMTLFKHIENKDVFQTFYTTRLSKRLIHGVSASDEAESNMISRLKDACGFEYTHKLQRMFTDMNLSKDITEQFKTSTPQAQEINFSIMVGGSNLWLLAPPTHTFTIPKGIRPTFDRFTRWYSKKHQGRKLMWLWNYSKNELRTNYLTQKYIFMTSAYQTAILSQYNTHDTLSLNELMTATSLPKEIIIQVLGLLTKAKVLLSEEEGQYDLNPGFKSKKIRVNLNQSIKSETRKEETNIVSRVEDERKFSIQATIVRIMKARQTMKSQRLIQEVVLQVSTKFLPRIPDIKQQLDSLLEKEYLARVEGTKDSYAYVA